MSFTSPYKQQNYMGEFPTDLAADTAIQARQWDTLKNGTGFPEEGMLYYNTTQKSFKFYDSAQWVPWEAPPYRSFEGPFQFNSVSPFIITTVLIGEVIEQAEVKITTVFDDPAATLQLGTPASPNLVLGIAEMDPNILAQFGTEDNIDITVLQTLHLLILPGASTQGNGTYHVRIRKA